MIGLVTYNNNPYFLIKKVGGVSDRNFKNLYDRQESPPGDWGGEETVDECKLVIPGCLL